MSDTSVPSNIEPDVGRNEPCPCGSGKKYKRCHGVAAAPKLGTPRAGMPSLAGMGGEGGDATANPLAGMDPQVMMQFAQQLQRLPKGQMQRLQGLMQKAMAGKDISREAEGFEKTLPLELQQMMHSMMSVAPAMAGMGGMGNDIVVEPSQNSLGGTMSADAAREIVAQAAAEGKISAEQAEELLKSAEEPTGISKLWRGLKK